MMWSLVQSLIVYLPEDFIKAKRPLIKADTGAASLPLRDTMCYSDTISALGFVASALFVQEKFTPESKQEVYLILLSFKTFTEENPIQILDQH